MEEERGAIRRDIVSLAVVLVESVPASKNSVLQVGVVGVFSLYKG